MFLKVYLVHLREANTGAGETAGSVAMAIFLCLVRRVRKMK